MDEQQTPPLIRLRRYLRTKGRNAIWTLKSQGLRGFWKNLKTEICGRVRLLFLGPPAPIKQPPPVNEQPERRPQVKDSAFNNRRKVIPASINPTRSKVVPLPPLSIDQEAVGQEIQRIKEELRASISRTQVSHE